MFAKHLTGKILSFDFYSRNDEGKKCEFEVWAIDKIQAAF